MTSAPNIFISYAEDTKPLAEELTRALQQQGIETWADFKDLQPGHLWRDELEQAIEHARKFLVLVGPNSRATRWQEWEWRTVLQSVWSDSGKTLIPLVVGANEPPPFLRDWVSLRIDPANGPTTWTGDVLQALGAGRNEAAHGLSTPGRRERQMRLDEIARAAKELDSREAGGDAPEADPHR